MRFALCHNGIKTIGHDHRNRRSRCRNPRFTPRQGTGHDPPEYPLIEFLQALIKDAGKKVFLILDNLRVHHSKLVKAWVAERKDQIELFYLPSYSPQLNPEERLNADLKQEMGKRVPVRTKAKLREAANDHMTMLEQNPERVMSYFQDRRVRYAA
jgi:transposase